MKYFNKQNVFNKTVEAHPKTYWHTNWISKKWISLKIRLGWTREIMSKLTEYLHLWKNLSLDAVKRTSHDHSSGPIIMQKLKLNPFYDSFRRYKITPSPNLFLLFFLFFFITKNDLGFVFLFFLLLVLNIN